MLLLLCAKSVRWPPDNDPDCLQLSRVAKERCEAPRSAYQQQIGQYEPHMLVFADESSLDMRVTFRLNGWSRRGTRARTRTNFVRGDR